MRGRKWGRHENGAFVRGGENTVTETNKMKRPVHMKKSAA
jgi:hypothetical protein